MLGFGAGIPAVACCPWKEQGLRVGSPGAERAVSTVHSRMMFEKILSVSGSWLPHL